MIDSGGLHEEFPFQEVMLSSEVPGLKLSACTPPSV